MSTPLSPTVQPRIASRRPRRMFAAAFAALVTLGLGLTHLAVPAGAQEAQPAPDSGASATAATTMTFEGRGWGHGRGMSQWGSQGYATQFNWDSARILGHYYGGTRAGTVGEATGLSVDPAKMRIRLMAQDDKPTVVANDNGALELTGELGYQAGGMAAVRLTKQGDGTLKAEQAASCNGPWNPVGATGNTGVTQITIERASGAEPLRLCRADGVNVWYPGTIRAVVRDGIQRTVNITSMDSQLRSTVPRESPASWDIEALKSQSVAARSYALAGDSRHQPYADTCDTTLCQVYQGWFIQLPGESKKPTTDYRTDAAINATAGVVRITSSGANAGRIARTEFSSTSGGWTAGGTFPAVQDQGDAISPLHTWTFVATLTGLEDTYGKGGRLVEIEVLKRNGLGDQGGRVVTARLHFDNGVTADVTGNTVRSRSGLRSDWFTPVCGTEVRYIQAVYQLFLGRDATGPETEARCADVRRGERFPLTQALSVTDEWAGVQINELYQKILGRSADSSGRAYWLAQVANGLRVEDIAAQFYGSAEYYNSVGSTAGAYVDALYLDLLGRTSDPGGRSHWVDRLRSGQLNRTAVAASFYASLESRRDRVDGLYDQILDRGPDSGGRTYWTDRLLTLGDVALAANLAASEEYYQRSLA